MIAVDEQTARLLDRLKFWTVEAARFERAWGEAIAERDQAREAAAAEADLADQYRRERDQARDMCIRLEHAIYKLGAWDPTNPTGREMIREDLERGGAASIERAQ